MTEDHKELLEWLDEIERGVHRVYVVLWITTGLIFGLLCMLIMVVTQ